MKTNNGCNDKEANPKRSLTILEPRWIWKVELSICKDELDMVVQAEKNINDVSQFHL